MLHLLWGHKTQVKHEKQQPVNIYLIVLESRFMKKCCSKFIFLGDSCAVVIDWCKTVGGRKMCCTLVFLWLKYLASNAQFVLSLRLQFKVCPKSQCVSTPGHRTDLFQRDPGSVLITDFFGSVRKVEITTTVVNLTAPVKQQDER